MQRKKRACSEQHQGAAARATPENQAYGKGRQENEQANCWAEDNKKIPEEPSKLRADRILEPKQWAGRRCNGHCIADERNSCEHCSSTKKYRERKRGAGGRTHDDTRLKSGECSDAAEGEA